MYCYSCGKENSDTAKFCKYCGTRMPDVGGAANNPNASSQSSQAFQDAPGIPNINMPQISVDTFTSNENVKNAISSKKCTDKRMNLIFGAGHIALLLLTFLPWFKAGVTEHSPYNVIKQLVDSISQGGVDVSYFIGAALIIVGVGVIILSSVYGAYMRFVKSYTANVANIAAVIACVSVFAGAFLIGISGSSNVVSGGINPMYGFYLTLVVSLVLSILGSGRIDVQKYLNGNGAPRQ